MKWDVHYKGHTIRVENSFAQQRLFVDGELQDELYGAGFRSRMYGKIRDEDTAGEEVRVSLGGTWQVNCRIFIDNRLVFHSAPDAIAAQSVEKNMTS